MRKTFGWLAALVVIAVLVAACGPQMATSTPDLATESALGEVQTPTSPPVEDTPLPTEEPGGEAESPPPPVDPDDWHVLGAPDAPVTIIEYSDFQ